MKFLYLQKVSSVDYFKYIIYTIIFIYVSNIYKLLHIAPHNNKMSNK